MHREQFSLGGWVLEIGELSNPAEWKNGAVLSRCITMPIDCRRRLVFKGCLQFDGWKVEGGWKDGTTFGGRLGYVVLVGEIVWWILLIFVMMGGDDGGAICFSSLFLNSLYFRNIIISDLWTFDLFFLLSWCPISLSADKCFRFSWPFWSFTFCFTFFDFVFADNIGDA